VDGQAHRSRVSTRIYRCSFRVVRHDGLFEQEAIPVCSTATRYFVYRLPGRAVRACGPACESISKIVSLGPQIFLISPK
jgi:hypothetical protein